MRIGPRYKIARRLGADLFPKTQSAKYALRAGKVMVKGYGRSEFGAQLKEKQRARLFYGLGERQFARYVANAIADADTVFVSQYLHTGSASEMLSVCEREARISRSSLQ